MPTITRRSVILASVSVVALAGMGADYLMPWSAPFPPGPKQKTEISYWDARQRTLTAVHEAKEISEQDFKTQFSAEDEKLIGERIWGATKHVLEQYYLPKKE